MKPSERITLIKTIAVTLAPESWRIIDLTLNQFGLRTQGTWDSDDREGYVIDMISDAEGGVLVDLAKHLGLITELESKEKPEFWPETSPRIFISHLAREKAFATNLKQELERFGLAGFVAHEDIEPSKEWQTEIELGLSTMDAMVAVLHPGFNESKWTDQEVGVAIGRGVPIIPLEAGMLPYGFIGKYQALKISTKNTAVLAQEIVELLASKHKIASKLSRALVKQLKRSGTWARAKQLTSLIEQCRQFSPDAIQELEQALATNDQVQTAWGVPETIKQILARNGA